MDVTDGLFMEGKAGRPGQFEVAQDGDWRHIHKPCDAADAVAFHHQMENLAALFERELVHVKHNDQYDGVCQAKTSVRFHLDNTSLTS